MKRYRLMEQRSFWRSAEYALFTFALPLALLLLIGSTTATGYLPGTHVEGQMLFVPSIIAFGVIAAAYVNLGAKLATLRHDGVLKRIRTTPLPAGAYLSRVVGSTAATTLAITACTAAIGVVAFGAVPRVSGLAEIAGGLVLGVMCFGVLGLALSSVARSAESASPIANASHLPVAIMSGIFDPTFSLPHWLSVVGLLPVRALAQILQQGYTSVERPHERPVRPPRLDRRRLRPGHLALPLALKGRKRELRICPAGGKAAGTGRVPRRLRHRRSASSCSTW